MALKYTEDQVYAYFDLNTEKRQDGCWIWNGPKDRHGYGVIKIWGKMKRCHRVSKERAHGTIPEGMVIDHICRVRSCVNPLHLEIVTRSENVIRGWATRIHHTKKNKPN